VSPVVPNVLRISGVITVVAGIVCGILVTPALFAIALVGVADFALASFFARRAERPY
jgi:hypothetical protein